MDVHLGSTEDERIGSNWNSGEHKDKESVDGKECLMTKTPKANLVVGMEENMNLHSNLGM
jgi:hypothetical protein